jgi:hypothetical protein
MLPNPERHAGTGPLEIMPGSGRTAVSVHDRLIRGQALPRQRKQSLERGERLAIVEDRGDEPGCLAVNGTGASNIR